MPSSTVISTPGGVASGLDDVRAHQQVGEVQGCRLGLVEPDPADPRGEVHDRRRTKVTEHVLGGAADGQVVLGTAGCDDVGARRPESGDDTSTEEPGTSRDEHAAIGERLGHAVTLRLDPPSWAACASPTPSSSAGTTRPAARPWRRSRSPAGSPRGATSRSSASPAATGPHRRRRGGRPSRSPSSHCPGRSSTSRGCACAAPASSRSRAVSTWPTPPVSSPARRRRR